MSDEKKAIPASKRKKLKRKMSRVKDSIPENERPTRRKKRKPTHVQETIKKPRIPKVSDEKVYNMILGMCAEAGLESTVRPELIAQALLPDHWQTLLKRVRLMASQQAQAGDLVILRKGKPADPTDFKGLVKFRITEQGLETVSG